MASPELEARPHAVYVIYGGEGEALYAGFTRNPEQRLKQHQRWMRRCGRTSYTVEWYPSRLEARIAEVEVIGALRPALNRPPVRVWH